ncbi:MAG: hypothetical protein QOJ23_3745 [Actinomycetota bacterium]|nr:hypothetical protein [Actinomycetota bacterium]
MEEHLRHLRDELQAAIGRTDEGHEDREELTRLQGAVESRLEGGDDDSHGLVDWLEKTEIRVESDHPTLGASIRQAIQSLTATGL